MFFLTHSLDAVRGEDGATAAEYAIMAALIAVIIIAAVTMIGFRVDLMFQAVADFFS